MLIDATTLSDLEVFRSPDGGDGLFQLIDRTASEPGRKALRRRLEHPLSDPGRLRRTQDAVRFFMRHPQLLRIELGSLEGVSRYLQSRIVATGTLPLGRHVEYLWLALRYRDVLRELEHGVRQTVALFRHLDDMSRAIQDRDPPELIGHLAARLRAAARAVREVRAGGANLLDADRAYRGALRDGIEGALAAAAELDALNAMALATAALGWSMPELVESDTVLLDAEDVIHPFVAAPVPNPVRLSGDRSTIFLTGPNMAGKTTYLRSVALVVFLAQVGMGVPARRARLAPVEALFTSLNPADNLRAGLSYFLAEVLRVRAAANLLAEGRRALILFDEVFKGTNVKDALEASAEVILGFARAPRSGFVFSSHLVELVDVLGTNPRIRFCCLDGDIVDGAPQYGYRLRDGTSARRFGLLLLREAGIPDLVAGIDTRAGARAPGGGPASA
jgi:DNA mismatch repair ATPase MutS